MASPGGLGEALGNIPCGGPAGKGRKADTALQTKAKSMARASGSKLGFQTLRGILGSTLGGRRR